MLASCGSSIISSNRRDGAPSGSDSIGPVKFRSLTLQTNDAAVFLRWSEPEDPNYGEPIDPNYKEVEITAAALDGSDDREIVVTVPRGITEYILKGLKKNTPYVIAIVAVSANGEKSIQRTRAITVRADATPPTEELEGWEVEKIDTGTAEIPKPGIRVKWSTASLSKKDIEALIVKLTDTAVNSDEIKEVAATAGYVDFENLAGTGTYRIEIEKYVDINGNEASVLFVPDGLSAIIPDDIPAEAPAALEGLKVEAKDASGAEADESILVTWIDPGAGATVEIVVKDKYGREYAGAQSAAQYAVTGLYGIEEYYAVARVFKNGRYSEAVTATGMTTDKTNDLVLSVVYEPVPTNTTILVTWFPLQKSKDYNGVRLTLSRTDPNDSTKNLEEYIQVLAIYELEYTFKNLTASTVDPTVSVTYKLKVETVDAAGNYNQVKNADTTKGLWEITTLTEAPPADETPPEVVTNIRAELEYLDVNTGLAGYLIEWDPGIDPDTVTGSSVTSTGVQSYEVHIQSGDEVIASETLILPRPSYTVDGLRQGESYTVSVIAVDRAGNKLDQADAATLEFTAQDKPVTPEASTVTATAAADGPIGLVVALPSDEGYLYKVRLVEGETAHAVKYDAANVLFGAENGIRAETAYTLKVSKMAIDGGAASGNISAEADVEVAASAIPKASLARITLIYPARRPQVSEGSIELAPILSIPDEDVDSLAAITYAYELPAGVAELPEGITFYPATGIFTIDLTNEIPFLELDITATAGVESVNYEADTSTAGSAAVGVVSEAGELRGVSFGDLPTTLTYGDHITLGTYVQVDQTEIDAELSYTANPSTVASISNGVLTSHQAGQVTVTVEASEPGFDAKTATVTITINKRTITADDVSYPTSILYAAVGAQVNYTPLLDNGLSFDDITFSGTLIAGLTVAATNGVISGMPTEPAAEAEYTITASVPDANAKFTGSVNLLMTIRVAYDFASIETYSDSGKTTVLADDVRKWEDDDSFFLYPKAEDDTGHEPAGTTYIFHSDNEAVITIDSHGEVMIVGAGTATIMITAGLTGYYSKTDTFTITIRTAHEYTTVETYTDSTRTTVFDDDTHGAKTYGDAAFTLYPKAEDSDGNEPAGTTYAYESDDTAVLTVDNQGKVMVVGAGAAAITVTASHVDYRDKTDTVTITAEKKALSALTNSELGYDSLTLQEERDVAIAPKAPTLTVSDLALNDLTFAEQSGTTLPTGLTLAANGTISGTPTETGQGSYAIVATVDAANTKYKGSKNFVFTIEILHKTDISTLGELDLGYSDIVATVDKAISNIIPSITNPNDLPLTALTFTTEDTFPAGLTLAADGAISGTPATIIDQTSYSILATVKASNKMYKGSVSLTVSVRVSYLLDELKVYTNEAKTVLFDSHTDSEKNIGDADRLYGKATDSNGNEPAGTTYAYTSDNEAVATVTTDNNVGMLMFTGAGNVTITVTAAHSDSPDKVASVSFNVVKKVIGTHDLHYSSLLDQTPGVKITSISPAMTTPADLPLADLTFSPEDSFPAGLTLAADGTISGTPTAAVGQIDYPIIATVKSENGKYTGTLKTTVSIQILDNFNALNVYSDSDRTDAYTEGITKSSTDQSFQLYPKAEDRNGDEPPGTTYEYLVSSEGGLVVIVTTTGEVEIIMGTGNASIMIFAKNPLYRDKKTFIDLIVQ